MKSPLVTMKRKRLSKAIKCCVILLALSAWLSPVKGADVSEIESRMLAARNAIESGFIRYTSTITRDAKEPSLEHLPRNVEFYFLNNSVRQELISPRFRTQLVFTPVISIKSTSPTTFVAVASRQSPSDPEAPNPRLLGITAWFSDNLVDLADEIFMNPLRSDFELVESDEEFEVRFKHSNTASGRYRLSKKMDLQPVFVEIVRSSSSSTYSMSIDVKLKRYSSSVCFPAQAVFRRAVNGVLMNEEVIEVKDAVFNTGVAESDFTLEALDLPKGRLVTIDGLLKIWDGNHLVNESEFNAIGNDTSSGFQSYLRIALVFSSILLAIIAFRVLRKKA